MCKWKKKNILFFWWSQLIFRKSTHMGHLFLKQKENNKRWQYTYWTITNQDLTLAVRIQAIQTQDNGTSTRYVHMANANAWGMHASGNLTWPKLLKIFYLALVTWLVLSQFKNVKCKYKHKCQKQWHFLHWPLCMCLHTWFFRAATCVCAAYELPLKTKLKSMAFYTSELLNTSV